MRWFSRWRAGIRGAFDEVRDSSSDDAVVKCLTGGDGRVNRCLKKLLGLRRANVD